MPRGPLDFRDPLLLRDSPVPIYRHVRVFGIPVSKGQPKDGTQHGPEMIRRSRLSPLLGRIGVCLEDIGNLQLNEFDEPDGERILGMCNPENFINNTAKIAQVVEEILSDPGYSAHSGHKPPLVLVGGDHSMAAGSIMGHHQAEPNTCVIWVDAHADINTPMTSPSGHTHGMPVAFLMKELQDEIPWMSEMKIIRPCLRASDIVYIGLRDLDPHEVYDLRKNGIVHFTMLDIDRMGIETVIRRAFDAVNPRLDRPIHLSFDIDAMDPSLAPSTGTPVPGGLTLREGLRICEEIYSTGKLSVMELVELNPLIGTPSEVETTLSTAVELLRACLGYRRSGHLPPKIGSLAYDGICSRADKEKTFLLGPLEN
ncbi:unnamed protein product [Calicophoron daubneyi]|uniref:Arginase n=1 Tax=Calicophoron daubneyi TaxID=300641 RepID=A0AAV2TZF2_CALDB